MALKPVDHWQNFILSNDLCSKVQQVRSYHMDVLSLVHSISLIKKCDFQWSKNGNLVFQMPTSESEI